MARAARAIAAVLVFAACQARPSPRPPSSIVLVTIDTLRADHVNATLTPALDALGREAVVFDQAITVAPLTLPAHASLLTGLYPMRHRVRDNEVFALPADVPTYPSLLKQRGYATAAFVSAVVLDHRYGLNRGFDLYDDAIEGPERAAVDTLTRAAEWLDRAPRTFFVWVHIFEPHAPYRTGSYSSEVTAADTALGRFFSHLRDVGVWDHVVLSVTGDHGESLGEHGEQTHGFFLYEAALRIPWILKAPGLKPRRVPHLVRLADELPTIAELASVSVRGETPPLNPDGVSLASRLAGTGWLDLGEAYSETFLPRDQFGWSALASIRTERLKYIDAPRPELYDLVADRAEATNIATRRPAEAERFKRVLGAMSRPPASPSLRPGSDPALADKLMSLGYVGSSPSAADADGAGLADPKEKIDVYSLTMTALEKSEAGNLPAALDDVERARRIDPNVAQVEFLRGTLFGQLGRFEEAAAALERTLALSPRYTAARFKLALAQLRLGRTERAVDALQQVVRQRPDDFRAWHNLAAIAYSRGDLDQAEALERKAVVLAPQYAEAWNTLGAIALVRKQTDAALEALTKATALAPKNAQAFGNLSLALAAAGQRDRARSAAERACTLDPRYCSTPAAPRQ